VFQAVHMLMMMGCTATGLGAPWQPGEERVNKCVIMVMHGRNLQAWSLKVSKRVVHMLQTRAMLKNRGC